MVLRFSTRGVRIPVGLRQTLRLAVQPAFLSDHIAVGFQLDSNSPQSEDLQSFQSTGANTSAWYSPDFLNRVLTLIQSSNQIYLGPAQSPNSVPITNLNIKIDVGALLIGGSIVASPNGENVDVVTNWSGQDLTLQDVSVTNTNCGSLDTANCFQLKLKYNLAAAFLKNGFSGKLLRPEGLQHIARFMLGSRALTGDFTASKLMIDGHYIRMTGDLKLAWE
jgi:hypothetical protein